MRLDIHNSSIPILCQACEARHKGICSTLDPAQLQQLGQHTVRREVSPGTDLIVAGVPRDSYSNILSGVVKLTKLMADGRQQIVGLQFAPDFLGGPFSDHSEVGAQAASVVRLCSFPRPTLERLIQQAPALEHRLHQQALRELDSARDWIMTLGQKTATEKTASFLLLLAAQIDPLLDGYSTSFDITLKRAEIADFLGLSIETVSRKLTDLRRAGVIVIERTSRITIPDIDALKAKAGR